MLPVSYHFSKRIYAGALLVFLTASTVAFGEGAERGGGDNPPPQAGSAWFLGTGTVRYCVEVSEDFGTTPQDAQTQIDAALAHWKQYVQLKGVNTDRAKSSPPVSIATDFQKNAACNGTENLAFYLGGTSAAIEAAKQNYYNPTAFAERVSYDVNAGWGKGFIWVAKAGAISQIFPNWKQSYALLGTLTHEVGHVFGNSHVPGTVMRGDFSSMMQVSDNDAWMKTWATLIDGYTELYEAEEQPADGGIAVDPKEAVATFQLFTGRAPVGPVRARFTLKPTPQLTLIDQHEVSIPIVASPNANSSYSTIENLDVGIFRVALAGTGAVARHYEAGTEILQVKMPNKKLRTVTLEMGLQNSVVQSPLVIWYVDQGQRKLLFYKVNNI